MKHTVINLCLNLVFLHIIRQHQSLLVVSKKHYDESKVGLDEKQLLERKIIMAQRTLDRLNLKLSVAKG